MIIQPTPHKILVLKVSIIKPIPPTINIASPMYKIASILKTPSYDSLLTMSHNAEAIWRAEPACWRQLDSLLCVLTISNFNLLIMTVLVSKPTGIVY